MAAPVRAGHRPGAADARHAEALAGLLERQTARDEDHAQRLSAQKGKLADAEERPADLSIASERPYRGLPEIAYPLHDRDALVTACGRICTHRRKINISPSLAGQTLGIKDVDDAIWLVSFMDDDLGSIDLEQKTLQPLDNPFCPRASPM